MAGLPALVLLALLALAAADTNPCHDNKSANGDGVTCEKVRLPSKLCSACKLKPPTANGNFVNCKSIYDLDDPACRKQLRKYADMNKKCDPVRPRQIAGIDASFSNKQGLDYFVYSICEECCDCIPIGATPSQFKDRKKNGKLLLANRGNCPAHAHFDICKVWPQVRYIVGKGVSNNLSNAPKVCPLLNQWINSPDGSNWLRRSFVPMNPNIKKFLDRFLKAAACKRRKVWEPCARLEDAQNRI